MPTLLGYVWPSMLQANLGTGDQLPESLVEPLQTTDNLYSQMPLMLNNFLVKNVVLHNSLLPQVRSFHRWKTAL
jgi:hypothetical protein